MSRHTESLSPDYFAERYAADPDPWDFETSEYERAKYAATVAALTRLRYASALEVGCSIGVLTEMLARRCDALLALDVAEVALDRAQSRCAGLNHVRFVQAQVPEAYPDGAFDLILLSEVVYYLAADDVGRLAARARDTLVPGGDIVLVHWTGETHYPLSGDEAAETFIARAAGFTTVLHATRTDRYRLDVLHRPENA